jgi:hypothetical protein
VPLTAFVYRDSLNIGGGGGPAGLNGDNGAGGGDTAVADTGGVGSRCFGKKLIYSGRSNGARCKSSAAFTDARRICDAAVSRAALSFSLRYTTTPINQSVSVTR